MFARCIALAAVLAMGSTAAQAAVAWSPSSGSTGTFSYANGQDATGLFGTGIADDSGFLFVPAGFVATASNGGSQSVGDTASADVTAAAGRSISSISAHVIGDYAVSGIGTATSVGSVTVTNLDTLVPLTLPILFTGVPAASVTSASGSFDGIVTVPLPTGWTHVHLDVADTVTATAGTGGSSVIQAKLADVGINTVLPEPAAIASIALLGGLLRRNRR